MHHGHGSAQAVDRRGITGAIPAGSTDHLPAEPAAVPDRRRGPGAAPRRRWSSSPSPTRRSSTRCSRARPRALRGLHPRRRQRLAEILGPGLDLHVGVLSFAFRLPGNAEPGSPAMIDRVVAAFREPVMFDDVPFDTRIGIGLAAWPPARAPAEDLRATLVGGAGQPRRAARLVWFDHKSDEAHRRAFRLLSDLKSALDADRQLELHYQPKVTLARAPAPASRRCCAGPTPSSARSRRASSWRSPRPRRSSRR